MEMCMLEKAVFFLQSVHSWFDAPTFLATRHTTVCLDTVCSTANNFQDSLLS